MADRLALMAKPKTLGEMAMHLELVQAGRPHIDAWTHAVPPEKQAQLQEQLRDPGYFWLLTEKEGTVHWRVKVTYAVFLEKGIDRWYDDVHDSLYDRPAFTLLVYAESECDGSPRSAFTKWNDHKPCAPQSRSGSGSFDYVLVTWE
jgi:hypothetical protein